MDRRSSFAALHLASRGAKRSEGYHGSGALRVVAAYAGEAVVREVIVRAPADVSEAHLQRLIRAVRTA